MTKACFATLTDSDTDGVHGAAGPALPTVALALPLRLDASLALRFPRCSQHTTLCSRR